MTIEIIPLLEGVSNATLTAYIQDASMDQRFPIIRPAIIICPGGAYIGITEKEAEPVALRFIAAGYHVFVLRYSIGTQIGRFPAPFIDAAKSVMLIRENAKRWYVDADKISLCGFSTGGHSAAVLSASWQDDYLVKAIGADSHLFKPNALILGYPLLDLYQFKMKSLKNSLDMQPLLEMMFSAIYGTINPNDTLLEEWSCTRRVTSNMPPTFLWTTSEDAVVDVEESLNFVKVLVANKIPYEFHIFEKGAHGLSLGDETVGYKEADMRKHVNVHKWVDLALSWLKNLQG
ncbi:alpha/beta hydrolase [Cellulosilyticum sp. I15G10I2]|uniref:alpha/beta hydrolase n=1 Tax=Cellulosilyticum sp. I15G10I2 TaxID=1892843 RepID=UPI00085C3BB1|nr:alpha/beta hydrolase [Cellulosilyticum sp. I15G10I2]